MLQIKKENFIKKSLKEQKWPKKSKIDSKVKRTFILFLAQKFTPLLFEFYEMIDFFFLAEKEIDKCLLNFLLKK